MHGGRSPGAPAAHWPPPFTVLRGWRWGLTPTRGRELPAVQEQVWGGSARSWDGGVGGRPCHPPCLGPATPQHCHGVTSQGGGGSLGTATALEAELCWLFVLQVETSGGKSFWFSNFNDNFLIWSLFSVIANTLTSGDSCCLCLLNFNAGRSKEHYDYLKRQGVMHFRLIGKEKLFKLEVHFAISLSMLLSLLSVQKNEMRIARLLIFFHYYLLICIQGSQKKYCWIQSSLFKLRGV